MPMLNLSELASPILLKGDEKTAFRDPAVWFENGTFYFFFTLVETEPDGKVYLYLATTETTDLIHFAPVRKLTPRNQSLNFSSPGNIVCFQGKYWLCCQTYCRENGEIWGNANSRIWLLTSTDLKNWTDPELIRVKGEIPVGEMGRMIDPYLIRNETGEWFCFFKQNGVSFSSSRDLKQWTFLGNTDCGENVCIIRDGDCYRLWHSPENGIGEKTSKDLIHWQDTGRLITLGQKDWEWAKGRLTAGMVLDLRKDPDIGKALLFYHGTGPEDERVVFDQYACIGIAWSDDLINWDYPGK